MEKTHGSSMALPGERMWPMDRMGDVTHMGDVITEGVSPPITTIGSQPTVLSCGGCGYDIVRQSIAGVAGCEGETMSGETIRVLLFSGDRTVREQVRLALGRKVASDLPPLEVEEVATGPALLRKLDADAGYGLVIMDGEAQPEGGFGLAHQIKEEYTHCPPVLLLVARFADAWLGTWSRAEALSAYPVDPIRLPAQVAELLRVHAA